MERIRFYNRNGWSNIVVEGLTNWKVNLELDIRERERDVQRQIESSKIREAKYNRRYKDIEVLEGCPFYLIKEI